MRGDGILGEKIRTSQMPTQKINVCSKFHPNLTMGNCSKSGGMVWGGKVMEISMEKYSKLGGKVWEEGGMEEFREKKCKRSKCHPKINLCRKSQQNRTMGKYSKLRKKLEMRSIYRLTDVLNPRFSLKTPSYCVTS